MSQRRPEVLSRSVQETDVWLHELMEDLHLDHPNQAYGALRAVLHALRDRLTVDEAAHVASQLPAMIRGIFYDGWRPAATPVRIRTRAEFIENVRARARGHRELDPNFAIEAVFHLLERKLAPGLIRKVVDQLPGELRTFFAAAEPMTHPYAAREVGGGFHGEGRGAAEPGWHGGAPGFGEMEYRHVGGAGYAGSPAEEGVGSRMLPGPHRGRGPRNYARSDARLFEEVNDRLTDDPFLDASDIEVRVENGEVTLLGTVESRAAKRRAEDLADGVSGVRHVQNNLRVAEGRDRSAPPEATGEARE